MQESHLAAMESAAREAGKLIRENLGAVSQEVKENNTLVTQVDHDCETLIKERLASFGYGFLGEETGRTGDHDYMWIVDPIDGTSNFAAGIPICVVSIGLSCRGELLAGVVYDPNHDDLFSAEREKGVRVNGKSVTRISTKKPMLLMDARYSRVDMEFYRAIHSITRITEFSVRSIGAAALALAYVATGRADAFLGTHQKPWDLAAGFLLCKEAGARITDWSGTERGLEGTTTLVAKEPLHGRIVSALSSSASETKGKDL